MNGGFFMRYLRMLAQLTLDQRHGFTVFTHSLEIKDY